MSGIFDMMNPNLESGGGAKPAEFTQAQLEAQNRMREGREQAKEAREQAAPMREGIRSAIQAEMARAKEKEDAGKVAFGARLESEKGKEEKKNEAKAKEMKAERRHYSEAYYKDKAEAARKKKEAEDKAWRDEHLYGHKPEKK